MDREASPERWYAFCCRFLTTPGDHRRSVPFHVLRWIAWASTDIERGARYAKALDRRQHTGRWPSWRHLSEGEQKSTGQSLTPHSDPHV